MIIIWKLWRAITRHERQWNGDGWVIFVGDAGLSYFYVNVRFIYPLVGFIFIGLE